MEEDFLTEFKVSLELKGQKRLSGDDLFTLLENIKTLGSISRAASQMDISYRYAWGLIREAEKALGIVLVEKRAGGYAGGGAFLTPEGGELLLQYKAFKQEVDSQLKRFLRKAGSPRKRLSEPDGDAGERGVARHLLLASTMEPVETGLLDVLEHAFYQDTGILVRHIAVGSGRALEIARDGRVDMVLSHAPELEEKFMQEGLGALKAPVMANHFVVAGPTSDPAAIKGLAVEGGVAEAFRRIALLQAPFVSRGDRSGTHLRELKIWQAAGINPAGKWYIVSSGLMGNMGTLRLAMEKPAYTLVDMATYLLSRSQDKMTVFTGGGGRNGAAEELLNIFSLILVNPERYPAAKFDDALLFYQWLAGQEGKEIIMNFGLESFGKPLFSTAGLPEK